MSDSGDDKSNTPRTDIIAGLWGGGDATIRRQLRRMEDHARQLENELSLAERRLATSEKCRNNLAASIPSSIESSNEALRKARIALAKVWEKHSDDNAFGPISMAIYSIDAYFAAMPSAIGRAPKWLVQAGGERYDTWLCATREDVRKAFCEALFGDVESATAAEIDGYMEEFDRSGAEQESKHPSQTWRFEDGWLGFITLSPAHDDIGESRG